MNTRGFGWCESVFASANQTSPGAENRCRSMGVTMLCSTSPTLSSETLPPQGHRERERERERERGERERERVRLGGVFEDEGR